MSVDARKLTQISESIKVASRCQRALKKSQFGKEFISDFHGKYFVIFLEDASMANRLAMDITQEIMQLFAGCMAKDRLHGRWTLTESRSIASYAYWGPRRPARLKRSPVPMWIEGKENWLSTGPII